MKKIFILITFIILITLNACIKNNNEKFSPSAEYSNAFDGFSSNVPRNFEGIIKFNMYSSDKANDPAAKDRESSSIRSFKGFIDDKSIITTLVDTGNSGSATTNGVYFPDKMIGYVSFEDSVSEAHFQTKEDYYEEFRYFDLNFVDDMIENTEKTQSDGKTTYKCFLKKDNIHESISTYMPLLEEYVDFVDTEVGLDEAVIEFTVNKNVLESSSLHFKGLFNKSTEYPLVFDLDMKYNYSTENVTAEYPETIEKYINMGDDENGAQQN